MNTLTVVVGFSANWETHLKKVQLAKAGIHAIGHHIFESSNFEDLRTIKPTLNAIINKVHSENGGSSVIFSNSEVALQWLNNAILLTKIPESHSMKFNDLTPIPEEQVNLYYFDEETKSMALIEFGELGYEIPFMNEHLNDLFEASLKIQDVLGE